MKHLADSLNATFGVDTFTAAPVDDILTIPQAIAEAREEAMSTGAFTQRTALSVVGDVCRVYGTPKARYGRIVAVDITVYVLSGSKPRALAKKDWL